MEISRPDSPSRGSSTILPPPAKMATWCAGEPQNRRSPGTAAFHEIGVDPDWYPAAVSLGQPSPSCFAAQ